VTHDDEEEEEEEEEDDDDDDDDDNVTAPRAEGSVADPCACGIQVAVYEDRGALCGGVDGGDVIRAILGQAPTLLSPRGPRQLWMEVDTSHPSRVGEWAQVRL
jgi:hypothetical protein